ncbi:Pentatricopeptide repeat-containing protein At2g18940, chloroplastic [Linum grandiflorum]
MDCIILLDKPIYPPIINRQSPHHPPNPFTKFTSAVLPPPPPPQSQHCSFPQTRHFEPILHQLLHLSPNSKLNTSRFTPPLRVSPNDTSSSVDYLSKQGKLMVDSIVSLPLHRLPDFFHSRSSELVRFELISLLRALDRCGSWERALLLFEWAVLNDDKKVDNQVVGLMVRILGRESCHTIACQLFDEMPLKEYELDVRAYTTILHSYSRAGKYEKAIDLFEWMRDSNLNPNLVAYNVMLDAYGKMGGSWSRILELLDEIRSVGLEYDEFTCSTVISACGREGLLAEASSFFAGLKSSGYVPGTVTYNALLQVFSKAGLYLEALSILEEMEENNCVADAVTYNEVVAAHVRAGFVEEGAAFLDTMILKGVMPDAVTYTTVINAYGKAGEIEKAIRLFDQMKKWGCVPVACTYNAIFMMLGNKSKLDEMLNLLADMRLNQCVPNDVTWNTMLSMCGKEGMQSYVSRVFEEMKASGFNPDRNTFNNLIKAYGRCGSDASATASKMQEQMIESGFAPNVSTYNALLNALACKGDWKGAELMIQDMRNKGFNPSEGSYSSILNAYAKAKNVAGIERIEDDIYKGEIFPSRLLMRTVVLAFHKCRWLAGAERAFDAFRTHGIIESGLQPDLVTYNSLMDMYARGQECWKAEKILKNLQEPGSNSKPDLVSYNTVIKGFCRQGLMQEAMRVLAEMMNTRGIRPCIFTYNTFVTGYAARGMFEEVKDVVRLFGGFPPELSIPWRNRLSYSPTCVSQFGSGSILRLYLNAILISPIRGRRTDSCV